MEIKTILLDMDGVLANWQASAARIMQVDPKEYVRECQGNYNIYPVLARLLDKAEGYVEEELWRRIDAAGARWWTLVPKFAWADALFKTCKQYAPTFVCTAPGHCPNSYLGKALWLKRFLGEDYQKSIIFVDASNKHLLAKEGTVLIDDRPSNALSFTRAGGINILFPQLWNTSSVLWTADMDDRVGYIERQLLLILGV